MCWPQPRSPSPAARRGWQGLPPLPAALGMGQRLCCCFVLGRGKPPASKAPSPSSKMFCSQRDVLLNPAPIGTGSVTGQTAGANEERGEDVLAFQGLEQSGRRWESSSCWSFAGFLADPRGGWVQEARFSLPNRFPGRVPQFPLLQSRQQSTGGSFGISRWDGTSEAEQRYWRRVRVAAS